MKRLLGFLKATLLGGVIFVLPTWLAVLLVVKAVMHLQIFVKPVTAELPESAAPRIIAVLLLIALWFVVGLLIQIRGFGAQLTEFEKSSTFQTALIEIDDALVPGFFVEERSNDRCTVFVPSAPTPMACLTRIPTLPVVRNESRSDLFGPATRSAR